MIKCVRLSLIQNMLRYLAQNAFFLASSEDELNYHMGEEHDKDFISYFETDFPCSVCDRWCRSEKELNRHMKIYHCKRVKFCSYDCKSCDEDVVDGKIPHVGNVQDMEIDESVSKTNPKRMGKAGLNVIFVINFSNLEVS